MHQLVIRKMSIILGSGNASNLVKINTNCFRKCLALHLIRLCVRKSKYLLKYVNILLKIKLSILKYWSD